MVIVISLSQFIIVVFWCVGNGLLVDHRCLTVLVLVVTAGAAAIPVVLRILFISSDNNTFLQLMFYTLQNLYTRIPSQQNSSLPSPSRLLPFHPQPHKPYNRHGIIVP